MYLKRQNMFAIMRRTLATVARVHRDNENCNRISKLSEKLMTNLKRVRRSVPEAVYVASTSAAERLVSKLEPHLGAAANVLEINPGLGFLTRELVNLQISKLHLFETSSNYREILQDLKERYPDKIEYKIEGFFNLWKLAFLDRLDSGDRIDKLFEGIKCKAWNDGFSMTIIGCMPSPIFIQHLIRAMIFQYSLIGMGRPEFFLVMSPLDYLSLESSDKNKYSYKQIPVLFNILFEHKLLAKLPREDFLPIQSEKSFKKKFKNSELIESEKDYLYLVYISAKETLPCNQENLPLLWYFCKHNLRNRKNCVIPKLEEWIPDCGIWLITQQDPPGTSLLTAPNENDEPLPHITIFTQFRDLSHMQILTLFKKFISWPEFEHSAFKEALDNHMEKYINNYDDSAGKIESIDQDDDIQET